jgi:hypothetical protein
MQRTLRRFTLALTVALAVLGVHRADAQTVARHVVVVTLDGLRWQEFFSGADRDYFKRDKDGSGGEPERRFWRDTPAKRREEMMPFMWKTIATRGQIFGAPEAGSTSRLTNGLWFSYPGYSELLAGVADPRIDSNKKFPNPNVTVLEWLNRRPGFEGRVAAFGSWDVLPSILNAERSGLVVGTGWTPVPSPTTDRERAINEAANDLPRYWDYGPFDAPLVAAALEHLRTRSPRVLYILLGETDEFAHEGRYDLYLDAARRADRFIERLWTTLQAMPEYAGRTALLVTTDHGRGATVTDWQKHGKDVPAAERTWMAMMGPGVAPLGLRRDVTVTTAQFAATIAAVLGEDFKKAVPQAAPAIDLAR